MQQHDSQILLLNSTAKPIKSGSFSVSYQERFAPLGLYCLSQLATKRISVVDLQEAMPNEELLAGIDVRLINTVILRVTDATANSSISEAFSFLKAYFANARVGLGGRLNYADCPPVDFCIAGTGHQFLLNSLRGVKSKGFVNDLHKDLKLHLPVPDKVFYQAHNYDAQPEKMIDTKTIEIFQPWLGLLEFEQNPAVYPGLNWCKRLIVWLKANGYNEFHFRPSGLSPNEIHELRSVMLNLACRFAVSFKNFNEADLSNNCAGYPLEQVWLYDPAPGDQEHFLAGLQTIKANNCRPCLAISNRFIHSSRQAQMLAISRKFSILDIEYWELADLKKVFYHYWSFEGRFFRRLLSVRKAQHLIAFMKSAALTLDIMLQRKGRE